MILTLLYVFRSPIRIFQCSCKLLLLLFSITPSLNSLFNCTLTGVRFASLDPVAVTPLCYGNDLFWVIDRAIENPAERNNPCYVETNLLI